MPWLRVVRSTGPLADVLREVPAGGCPPFPAQNAFFKAHWAPGIRPTSHTAVLSVSRQKQSSQDPRGRAISLRFLLQIVSIKVLSSTLPSFGTDFPVSSIPLHPAPERLPFPAPLREPGSAGNGHFPCKRLNSTLGDCYVKRGALSHAERATGF